jgi:hypothetical protein
LVKIGDGSAVAPKGESVFGIESDCLVVIGDGSVVVVFVCKSVATVPKGEGALAIESDRFVKIGDGSVVDLERWTPLIRVSYSDRSKIANQLKKFILRHANRALESEIVGSTLVGGAATALVFHRQVGAIRPLIPTAARAKIKGGETINFDTSRTRRFVALLCHLGLSLSAVHPGTRLVGFCWLAALGQGQRFRQNQFPLFVNMILPKSSIIQIETPYH